MYCIHCGAKNEDTHNFCTSCGQRLVPPSTQVSAAAAVAAAAPTQPIAATSYSYEPVVTEPAYTPEPAYVPEPAYTPEPEYAPEPTYVPEPLETFEPEPEPEPMPAFEYAAVSLDEGEPEPEPEPELEPEPESEPEPEPDPEQPTGKLPVISAGPSQIVLVRMDGAEFCATSFPALVGKSATCDVQVSGNPAISRTHARLSLRGEVLVVEDCESTNGTFLNGLLIRPGDAAPLRDGDTLKLADEKFTVRL